MTIALFPGQGVQAAGMDGGLAAAAPEVFDVASDVLGVDVAELCRDGRSGRADLASTRWAQPAVLTCSVASYGVLRDSGEPIAAVAGHSIGEYPALVVSGVLGLADAVRLVALRAAATDDAAQATPGGMAAVMRAERSTIEDICKQTGAALAADNSAGQLVISGATDALEQAKVLAAEAGAVVRSLDVAGAFHSPLMSPASAPLAAALDGVTFSTPTLDLWSSTTAAPIAGEAAIKQALIDQLVSPVLFRETVSGLAEKHGSALVDVGPGKIVGALARRIVPNADVRFVADLLPAGQGERQS
jgi:[acyl-carrier-protein] S-malonyltransferase